MGKRLSLIIVGSLCLAAACQPVSTATVMPASPPPVDIPATLHPAEPGSTIGLKVFTLDLSEPFYETTPRTWSPAPYAGPPVSLPLDLASVANSEVLTGLTAAQRAFLAQNGFVVIHSQEAQFNDIRYSTAYVQGQPFFRTIDEAYHALHLQFDDLLKSLERQGLRPQLLNLLRATRDQVRAYASEAAGTSIETDLALAEAYLEVAIQLFDPAAPAPQVMTTEVAAQLKQITDTGGRDNSVLFPDFEDDYGAYKPVGHYAGDPDLEAYFRGMTWLGRVHFPLADVQNPAFQPSRLPLIITLALRQAVASGRPASDVWSEVNRLLDFLVGPTDDLGPVEYAALMDAVYGPAATFSDLADDSRWETFLASTADLPTPQINSTFVDWTAELEVEKGWRLMGQRFTMDANIFQNLIFDKVGELADGTRRNIPTGLDVMAVFGSGAAMDELSRQGAMAFPNYEENLGTLKEAAEAQPESEWLGRAYSAWLYSFLPVVAEKGNAFPDFMRTAAWDLKDLNAALGSWAELKHDTVLYAKMAEAAGGGGPPTSEPAPSYVEPNPLAFYRMAYIARTIGEGLEWRIDPSVLDAAPPAYPDLGVRDALYWMTRLADDLDMLGDAAARQLAGEDTADFRSVLTRCLGFHECTYTITPSNRPPGDPPEVPIVAAVSGFLQSVLEAATGYVDRIYVIVPLEGGLEVTQGGVFSYYEFIQPRDQRLTDDEWRQRLDQDDAPPRPAWVEGFSLDGGSAADALFFRVGDTYVVAEDVDFYNLRASPSYQGEILGVLERDSYLTIIGGPVETSGDRWWQVSCEWCSFLFESQAEEGWILENPDWLVRSY